MPAFFFGTTEISSLKENKSAVKLTWQDGGLRPFHPDLIPADEPLAESDSSNGVMLLGTKGIITCGTYGNNPKVYKKNGDRMEMPKADPNAIRIPENGHQAKWGEACKAGFDSALHKGLTSSFDFSGPLTESILMGNLAIRSYALRKANPSGRANSFVYEGRKKLLWDGASMRITNFEEANQFVKRTYREGWSLGV